MVERVSTISIHQRAVNDVMRVQGDLAKVQDQISSGRKASTFTELGPDITKVLDFESSIKTADKQVNSNEEVISRLNMMGLAVTNMIDIITELRSEVIREQTNADTNDLAGFARSALDRVAGSLNTELSGRYLFSGSRTNTPPIGDLKIGTNIVNDTATSEYYKGDDFTFSIKANSQLDVEYGIKANDTAFQNVIAALNKAIEIDASGLASDSVKFDDFFEKALKGLVSVQSQIGADGDTLAKTNLQLDRLKGQLNTDLSDTIGTDLVEASIQAALNEATLTATLQIFVRISNLNLSDFMR